MKTITFLTIILFCLFATEKINGQDKQKDSVIVITGVIDKRDIKRVVQNLEDQIENGRLDGAINSAQILNKKLRSKDLEKIIEVNIKLGWLPTANRAATMNGRKLEFKEIYTALWVKEFPMDTVTKYLTDITPKNAEKFQKFYINKGDLKSAEASSKISGKRIESSEFVKISKVYFQKKNINMAILSARKGGTLGREELGKLLKIFVNLKDLESAVKVAAAIGGKNMSVSEWAILKKIIPPEKIEDTTEFINKGSIPKME